MPGRILKLSVLLPFVLAAALYGSIAAAAVLPEQSSQANGVTVSVKPGDLSTAAKAWTFNVVLTTHTGDLSDDLTRTITLVDASGKPQLPTGWDGSAPGGHHRNGVLRFKPLSPRPDAVELRMARPGEATPRTFRWKLK